MIGNRSSRRGLRSAKHPTKRESGGGKRESCGGPRDERGRTTEYERVSQHEGVARGTFRKGGKHV